LRSSSSSIARDADWGSHVGLFRCQANIGQTIRNGAILAGIAFAIGSRFATFNSRILQVGQEARSIGGIRSCHNGSLVINDSVIARDFFPDEVFLGAIKKVGIRRRIGRWSGHTQSPTSLGVAPSARSGFASGFGFLLQAGPKVIGQRVIAGGDIVVTRRRGIIILGRFVVRFRVAIALGTGDGIFHLFGLGFAGAKGKAAKGAPSAMLAILALVFHATFLIRVGQGARELGLGTSRGQNKGSRRQERRGSGETNQHIFGSGLSV